MATVTQQVGEVLLGITEEPQLSSVMRDTFFRFAVTDDKTGDQYLDPERFIDAVAPESEDYVNHPTARLSSH
jgi:solute carrier family 25 aspartate/glutamate transporter 12/13